MSSDEARPKTFIFIATIIYTYLCAIRTLQYPINFMQFDKVFKTDKRGYEFRLRAGIWPLRGTEPCSITPPFITATFI